MKRYIAGTAAALMLVACQLGASTWKPFTPELMLQNEDVGEVRFSPDGNVVFMEKLLAYNQRQHFDRVFDWNRGLSVLNAIDAATGRAKELRSGPEDRTWYLGSSPNGEYVAFGWFDGDTQRIGLLQSETGKETRLAFGTNTSVEPVTWLSEHQFLMISMDSARQYRDMANVAAQQARIAELSRKTWQGQASVKVDGSGRYFDSVDDPPVSLVQVDARNAEIRTINKGNFGVFQVLAPTGGRVAYLRKTGALDLSGLKVDPVHFVGNVNELNIYEPGVGNRVVPICKGCSVDDGSLRWSPSGRQLYYSVRHREGSRLVHLHYLHDLQTGRSTSFRPGDLAWDTEIEHALFMAPLLWLDEEHLALRTRSLDAGEFEDQGFRWHLVTRSGQVLRDLTADVPRGKNKQAFKQPVATHHGSLLLISDGQLWRIPQQGAPASLTKDVAAEVDSWCAPYAPWRPFPPRCDALKGDPAIPPVPKSVLDRDRLALRVMDQGVFTGEFVFLDLVTGRATRLSRPTEDSVPLEVSPIAEAGVFQRSGTDGDEILLVRAKGKPLSIHRFNSHLAGVRGSVAVRLQRQEAGEKDERNDWLLLPPGHKAGERHPLLVYFYPDQIYGKELKADSLRRVSFLNKNIPTNRGFAVLLASMKISDFGTASGNPMAEMHEQLIHAAENAVAKGYADPEKWAIMGHSYGGYGTLAVIANTGRFKAAVALDGIANLTSKYGDGMRATKAYPTPPGMPWTIKWAESGQGRMGVPPWEDPKRYMDNSPLFKAHRITTPLMLVHGDLDRLSVSESEQMFLALYRQGKDAQLVRYWGEGHVYYSPGNISDMWNRILEFLGQNLQRPTK